MTDSLLRRPLGVSAEEEKWHELWELRRLVQSAANGDCEPAKAYMAWLALGGRPAADSPIVSFDQVKGGNKLTCAVPAPAIVTRIEWSRAVDDLSVTIVVGNLIIASLPMVLTQRCKPFRLRPGQVLGLNVYGNYDEAGLSCAVFGVEYGR